MASREGVLKSAEPVTGLEQERSTSALREVEDLREANQNLVLATLVAERLQEESARTKRLQDEFLAMLAHELRNPLAPIRTAATLLDRLNSSDPRLTTISEVIGRQVEYMARLLDDLLDASRITRGKVTLQRRAIRVREFVDQAVEIYRDLIDANAQQLTLDFPVTPIYVDGDPTRLAQIVGNLLHNAAKYTQKGGAIALVVRLQGDSVELTVADNGAGTLAKGFRTYSTSSRKRIALSALAREDLESV